MRQLISASAAILGLACLPATASLGEPLPLSQALRSYAKQQGQAIIFTEDVVAGLNAPPNAAPPSATADLQTLLAGTDLVADRSPSGAWMIRRRSLAATGEDRSSRAGFMRTAQQGPITGAAGEAPPVELEAEEVIVSGTRVVRDGFDSPTPTTVLSTADIQSRGINNVIEALNEIPAFRPSQTPAAGVRGGSTSGGSFLDLRGLNGQGNAAVARTLVLVDGRRFATSNSKGQVDVSMIPTSLIERTEVVTGGASAAWGSDAVAGVVNLILKDRLQGVEANMSYGRAEEGDNEERSINLAAGTSFAGGRGHLIAGGEFVDSDGIPDQFLSRDWGARAWGSLTFGANRPAGVPSRVNALDARISDLMFPGGVIVGGPLDNIKFLGGQQTGTFVPGSLVAGIQMVGGQDNAGVHFVSGSNLVNPIERYAGLARASFDITDSLGSFVEFSVGDSEFRGFSASRRDAGTLVIRRDNAFLPESVRTQMTLRNLPTINVGRIAYDDNYGFYFRNTDQETRRVAVGLQGELPADFTWNTYFQWGENEIDQQDEATLNANYIAAVDAVRDASGNIVCRPGAVGAAPGCVPFNIFGRNSPSQAAVDYVTGTGLHFQTTKQRAGALTVNGSPFSIWAGPVSLAAGLEYRKEISIAEVDADSLASRYDLGNFKPLDGSYFTREAFIETVVPLLQGKPFAHSLELNAAGRRTDYSTSGAVSTWKLGLGYEPAPELRLRATVSRDIRAPNINELFSTVNFTRVVVANPFTGQAGLQVDQITTGNPALTPEAADTFTAGVLYQPSWAPRLRASFDYYSIKIDEVISQFTADVIVNQCFAGVAAFCGNIVFGPGNSITRINNQQLNFNSLETSGLDFELSYGFGLEGIGLPGQLGLRAFGTYVSELTTIDPAGAIDRVLQTVPRITANLGITYSVARFSTLAQLRILGSTLQDTTLIGPDDSRYSPTLPNSINLNKRDRVYYLNLSGNYRLIEGDRMRVQLFGVANNVFDKSPPPAAELNATTASLYDLVGRSYKAGVRISF